MRLTFFEEELDDVDIELRRLGQRHPIRRWGAECRLSNTERRSVANRNDLGDWGIAVKHGDGLAPFHGTEVLAQPGLQFGDAHLLHSHSMTRSSHGRKKATRRHSVCFESPLTDD